MRARPAPDSRATPRTPEAQQSAPALLHVDMDAFFASVCLRDRPELQHRPVVVGGGGQRGVVLAANYPARRFGVRSAISMARARRLCPEVVVLAPDYPAFESVSTSVMEIFEQVTPLVEPISLDEALLDVSGAVRRLGAPRAIAEHIRARVSDEQHIACSVGVASSPSVAKVASRRAKPDGVLVVPPDRVTDFLHPLDVGELHGVGERTREQLLRLGLRTVGQLAHTPLADLQRALGEGHGSALHRLAWGTDRRRVGQRDPGRPRERSMGAEETFGHDTDDREVVVRELLHLAARVTGRMRRAGLVSRTIVLRVRFADFRTLTRSRTLPDATDQTSAVHTTAVGLLDGLDLGGARLRLVGVRAESLVPRVEVHRQLELGARDRGWDEADRAVDAAARRFGGQVVSRASLLDRRRP